MQEEGDLSGAERVGRGVTDAADERPRTVRGGDVRAAVAAVSRGELVVVVDDEDRENEGDLVMAADLVTAEAVNFMITHGRGLVCVTVTAERAEQLALAPMVRENEDPPRRRRVHLECFDWLPSGPRARGHAFLESTQRSQQTLPQVLRPGLVVEAAPPRAECSPVVIAAASAQTRRSQIERELDQVLAHVWGER